LAAAQDFVGVDVEGLRVEGERPEEVFARVCGGGCWAGQEGAVVGLDFGGARVGL
tara:strand:+ start:13461 stop:13625 length:165 start_codon:yes stop_codon:yes gene_type:complete